MTLSEISWTSSSEHLRFPSFCSVYLRSWQSTEKNNWTYFSFGYFLQKGISVRNFHIINQRATYKHFMQQLSMCYGCTYYCCFKINADEDGINNHAAHLIKLKPNCYTAIYLPEWLISKTWKIARIGKNMEQLWLFSLCWLEHKLFGKLIGSMSIKTKHINTM